MKCSGANHILRSANKPINLFLLACISTSSYLCQSQSPVFITPATPVICLVSTDSMCFHSCTSCLVVQKGKRSISPIFPLCLFLHFYPETIEGRRSAKLCLIHCPSLFLPESIEGAHFSGGPRIARLLFNLSYFSAVSASFLVPSVSFS